MGKIVVVDYDPQWVADFEQLSTSFANVLGDIVLSIEHVGSTSVPGLTAKPIIDLDIVVNAEHVPQAIERLATLGYQHLGNRGVEGREAFDQPPHPISHHVYVCEATGLGLRNHLVVRDYLRSQPDAAAAYGQLKRELANSFSTDIDSYIDGKTDFIQSILRASLTEAELAEIEAANRKTP